MGIHWSLPLLEGLLPDDLNARLKEAQNDPFLDHPPQDEVPMVNGLTGKVMKALPIPKTIRVSRRKMRAFCTQDLDVQVGDAPVSMFAGKALLLTIDSMAKSLSKSLMGQMVSA